MSKRRIFLIAGPSGSGKTTLVEQLCRSNLGVSRAVTVTTREPRIGETDGRDYYFVSPLTFEGMRLSGQFLETTTVYNESYGTPREAFTKDEDLAVIVTPDGARHLSEILCDTHTVFIEAAGPMVAAERVRRRNARNAAERLRLYDEEMAMAGYFETIIVNNNFDRALSELSTLVIQSRFDDWKMCRSGLQVHVAAKA